MVSSYYTIYCVDHETARYVETPRALSEAISRTREPRVILNFSKLSLAKPTSLIVDITRRGMGAWNARQWAWRNVTQCWRLCARQKLNVVRVNVLCGVQHEASDCYSVASSLFWQLSGGLANRGLCCEDNLSRSKTSSFNCVSTDTFTG